MNIPKYVGDRIKYYRTKNNLTQQEVGEYLGTTSQTISRYESGVLEANQDVLFNLANYFKISINDFFPPLTNPNKNETTHEEELSLLKEVLKDKGFLNENEELSEETFNELVDFAIANKKYIMKSNEKK